MVSAYLDDGLKEDNTYMQILKDLDILFEKMAKILHILKTVHGLKQVKWRLNKNLKVFITNLNWKHLQSNLCLYIIHTCVIVLILIVYINNMLIGRKKFKILVTPKEELQK